jgi:alpha-mannosidase
VDAEKKSKALIDEVLRSYATGSDSSMVDVHNSCSWSRSEVVVLSKEMSSAGDHVKDERGTSVPSQRLSSGELAFLAQEVCPSASDSWESLASGSDL